MKNNLYLLKLHKILKNNKGFTLVELIVVLVLMSIMISISIAIGLGWKDWADFNHENSMAEEIFFAAQNQLTEYDSSQTLDLKVISELKKVGADSDSYDSSIVLTQNMLEQISYDMNGSEEVKYRWSDVWKLNQNPDSQRGTILRLKAAKGDYKDYLAGTLVTKTDKSRLGAKILFDIISGYVSDSGALDAAIILEFSPDSGQVFSVCYSDRYDLLLYSGETAAQGKTYLSVMNRILRVRESNMLGYYSVTELAQRIKGRGMTKTYLELDMENSELLTMKVTDKANVSNRLGNDDSLIFNIYNGQASGSTLMSFNIDYKNIKEYSTFAEGLSKSAADPMKVTFNMQSGLYRNNSDVIFRLPVWRIDNEIYIVLDAADVQAQTLAYSESIYFGQTYSFDNPNPGELAFRNTYSFYRFGLADITNYIYADVSVGKLGFALTDAVESGRIVNNKHVSHSKLASDQKDGFKGECVCFGEYSKDINDNVNIDINNARHLYNIRYETDYKRQNMDSVKETYKLMADISWKDFTGQGEDSAVNYFVNSYDSSMDNTTRAESGIDYDGKLSATRSVESGRYTDTALYPFPGYRKLDRNDTFTQDKAYTKEDNESYIISDLNLSVSANVVYGVYGKTVKNKCINQEKQEDYSKIIGKNTDGTGDMNDSRAGKLPLGLFAENLGEISNITLNRHAVEGMEIVNREVVYTCMVGGFTGNNIGKLDKLSLLDLKSDGSTKANISRITGRTDVGGILGRESFAASESDDEVVLGELLNYAEVTGVENIGGIVGRVWVNYPTGEETQDDRYYRDGYSISGDNKSMTDEDIFRAEDVILEKCINRGYVYGLLNDKLLKEATVDGKKADSIMCSFIGGIAGITMDGELIDDQIPEDYLDRSSEHIKLVRCNSYISYDIASDEVINNLSSTEEHPSLTNDNYVGGLVGYGRLTVFEKCNTKPDADMMSDNASKTFVFGNRYVGGLIGCAELCRFDEGQQEEDEEKSDYAVTNYNNVIGRLYVGGVAGANGIGSLDSEEMNYREPSENKATPASRISAEDNSILFYKALNNGAVLSVKNSKPFIARVMDEWNNENYEEISEIFSDEELSGISGGIVGLNVSSVKECDNIQTEDTKRLAMKLVTGAETDLYSNDVSAEDVNSIIASSAYGGNAVGGIVGACFEGGTVNVPTDDWATHYESKVDAFVFGQDYVGGCVGITKTEASDVYDGINKISNNDSTVSSGTLVAGRDAVGGYVGRLGGLCWDYESTTVPYKVKGRYAVGGVFGVLTSDNELAVTIDPAGINNRITVDGIAYVGGYIGVADSGADIKLLGVTQKENDLDDIKIYGRYFAGGIAGCIAGTGKTLEYIVKPEFAVGQYVTVEADAYAGGIAGLYTIDGVADDFCSVSEERDSNTGKLHRLVSEKLVEADSYVNYEKAFKNIADSDIYSGSIFEVPADNECRIDFSDYTNKTDSNPAAVISKLYSGGLFGYVPEAVNLTVNGFVNNGNINVSETVSSSDVTESLLSNIEYAYMGGVIGRVSNNMTLINCLNKKRGEDLNSSSYYISKASYIGGLTEVNAGVIRGTGEKDSKGKTLESGYLTQSVNATYSNVKYGAIAGINGTSKTEVSDDGNGNVSDNSTGLIIYCRNTGASGADKDEVTGEGGCAAGIVSAIGGNSAVVDCLNDKQIQASDTAAGIIGEILSGECIIDSCTNSANMTGTNTAAGILGADTNSGDLTVRKCENIGTIASLQGNASGIVGKGSCANHNTADSFVIDECINHGAVDAGACASGIISDNDNGYVSILNSVNTGVITISEQHPKTAGKNGSKLMAAGIVCDTHQKGVISKCRNYGTGLYYGITKEPAESIHYSLDASYADAPIGPVANAEPTVDKHTNFYLGDKSEIDRPKRFKAMMTYADSGEEIKDINSYVLGSDQNGDNPVHHDESGGVASIDKNNKTYKLKYAVQPVYNFVGTEATNIGIDAFSILWDNYEKSAIEEYMAPTLNKETDEYAVFEQYYALKAQEWINDANITVTLSNFWYSIWYNLTNDKETATRLRERMGISAARGGLFGLGGFSTKYTYQRQDTPYYNHTSGENYYSDYAYATYYYMIKNYPSEEINDDLYQRLLFGNAERYGKIAYDNSKRSYNISYHMNVYSNNEVIRIPQSTTASITTSVTENASYVRDTYVLKDIKRIVYYLNDVRQSQAIMITGSYEAFSSTQIDGIEVIIDSCTSADKTVGVRAFKWNESGALSNAEPPVTDIMLAHDTELTEDYYAGISDIVSFLDAAKDVNRTHVYMSEVPLYTEEDIKDGVTTHKIMSYGFDTGIAGLVLNMNLQTEDSRESLMTDYTPYSADSTSNRLRLYKQLDSKYLDFINSYEDGVLSVNTGVGLGGIFVGDNPENPDSPEAEDSHTDEAETVDEATDETDDDSSYDSSDEEINEDDQENEPIDTASPGDAY